MTPRRQDFASFSIFDTCREGLTLLLAHSAALRRVALLPLAVVGISTLFLAQIDAGIFPIRAFLYELPGLAATGWLIFIAARLWLLGELPGAPRDDTARAERARLMQASIMLFLLWKAALAIYEQVFLVLIPPTVLADPALLEQNPATMLGLMILMGVLFWALRFRVLPILAAVGYPLRDYMAAATGFALSFRLLGLVLICLQFPRMLIAFMLLPLLGSGVVLVLIVQVTSLFFELWLFAAFTVALRRMLGRAPGA